MKTFTATEFRVKPGIVYRTADLEGGVEIIHFHYPHKRIIIVVRDKECDDQRKC